MAKFNVKFREYSVQFEAEREFRVDGPLVLFFKNGRVVKAIGTHQMYSMTVEDL